MSRITNPRTVRGARYPIYTTGPSQLSLVATTSPAATSGDGVVTFTSATTYVSLTAPGNNYFVLANPGGENPIEEGTIKKIVVAASVGNGARAVLAANSDAGHAIVDGTVPVSFNLTEIGQFVLLQYQSAGTFSVLEYGFADGSLSSMKNILQ